MKKQECFIGVDIGTSSCKAVLFHSNGTVLASSKKEYPLNVLPNGFVEQNATDFWNATVSVIRSLNEQKPEMTASVIGIGLTGQVPTDIFVDENIEPLCPCISWQDTRAKKEAEFLKTRFTEKQMQKLVGSTVPISPSWSASRLLWFSENRQDLLRKCRWVLMPKDFVGMKLTGGDAISDGWCQKSTVNLQTGFPCEELMEVLKFPSSLLPKVQSWESLRGTLKPEISKLLGFGGKAIPVSNGCSDAPATILGCGILESNGIGFNSCGTSEIVGLSVTPSFPCVNGLMTIPSSITASFPICYGPTQSGSGSLVWLSEQLLGRCFSVEQLLASVKETKPTDLLFLPYLSGERAPLWNPDVRGRFVNIGKEHSYRDFTRAVLEGVGFSVRHCLSHIGNLKENVKVLRLTGGGSRNPEWNQIKADICGIPLEIPECDEACALGAAMTVAVGTGFYSSFREASEKMIRIREKIEPDPNRNELYNRLYKRYLAEVDYSVNSIKEDFDYADC